MGTYLPLQQGVSLQGHRPYRTDGAVGFALRLADVAGRPFGISVASFRPTPLSSGLTDRAEIFDEIAGSNTWGSKESVSGNGSAVEYTETYRAALVDFLRRRKISSMFDAPCGDLNWMPLVLEQHAMQYIGGDVSDAVLGVAKRKHPEFDLRHFDLATEPFPDVQVWHCRDCLFHLSYADIDRVVSNFLASGIEYALLTSHRSMILNNVDIPTGSFRLLDLMRAPFRFPPPIERLTDFRPGRDFPRYVGVWTREQLKAAYVENVSPR